MSEDQNPELQSTSAEVSIEETRAKIAELRNQLEQRTQNVKTDEDQEAAFEIVHQIVSTVMSAEPEAVKNAPQIGDRGYDKESGFILVVDGVLEGSMPTNYLSLRPKSIEEAVFTQSLLGGEIGYQHDNIGGAVRQYYIENKPEWVQKVDSLRKK